MVIGNGMVSHYFCKKAVENKLHHQYDIVVIGEENLPAYDRIHLTNYLSDLDAENLILSPETWYSENNIQLVLNRQVVHVDTDDKIVKTNLDDIFEYSRLIFATGSYPFIPPIEGVYLPGVFAYRKVKDLDKVYGFARTKETVAVIGGGLLGLEVAKALNDMGLRVTVLEFADYLMPRQLELESAEVLKKEIEKRGIKIICKRSTKKISHVNNKKVLEFEQGDEIEVDMVLVSAGIKPRDELAIVSGIACGPRGGIAIDNHLKTSAESVYAIGECALHEGLLYGLAAPGYAMADVLVRQFLGQETSYNGSSLSTTLKFMGIDVAVHGDYLSPGTQYFYKEEGIYRKIITQSDKITGVISIGEWKELAELQNLINQGAKLKSKEIKDFQKKGLLWPSYQSTASQLSDGAIICNCMCITKGKIMQCMKEKPASLDDLCLKSGAGLVCGSCKPVLNELYNGDDGTSEVVEPPRPSKSLLVGGFTGILFCLFYWLTPAFTYSHTVQNFHYSLESLWKDNLYKQISGFTMLTLLILILILPFRKRMKKFNWLSYEFWRNSHIIIGLIIILGSIAHTGLHFGSNLNMIFMNLFILLSLTGSLASLGIYKAEGPGRNATFRIIFLWLHIILFWPFPILLGFHILSSYYY